MLFPRSHIDRHYRRNREADLSRVLSEDGLLNGQGRPGLSELSFGYSHVGHAGCESIAVYNALLLLGLPQPLPDIIRAFEKGGYMRFGGYMGAAPYFQPLLRRCGAESRVIRPARAQTLAERGELDSGAVFLAAIWNDRLLPFKGLHTFAVCHMPLPDGKRWTVYNRFNSDAHPRRYVALDDILRNGKQKGAFLVMYRVIPLT